jgi:hypothetical protein
LEPEYDSTRIRIKEVYNFYLKSSVYGIAPPVPRYGFLFRSSVVKAIPDLKITVSCRKSNGQASNGDTKSLEEDEVKNTRNPVVRLTKMDDFTILCLLDCLPEEINEIKISQPPHQQRYAMGESLAKGKDGSITAEVIVRMMYTTTPPKDFKLKPGDPLPNDQPDSAALKNYYDSKTRAINPIFIAEDVNTRMNTQKTGYQDDVATSCLIGLQLSDPCCKFLLITLSR